jgi:RNA polymerase sigma factor (sigma-70 family)
LTTDAELVTRALAGDSQAYGQLAERYAGRVRAWILRRVHSPDDTDDLVQEVLVRAWSQLGQLRQPARYAAWLRSIADNTARTWQRRGIVQLQMTELLIQSDAGSPAPAANEAAPSPVRQIVREAVRRLSARQQQVVVHHYLKGYAYGETAALLDLNTRTVKSRLQKARGRLRKELETMTDSQVKPQIFSLTGPDMDALRWAVRFASDDIKRPVLRTVYLDAGGKIIATDGARLLLRNTEGCRDLAVPVLLGPLDGFRVPEAKSAVLTIGENEASLQAPGQPPGTIQVMEGPYVKYEMVVPAEEPAVRLAVASDVLLKALDALDDNLHERHPLTPDQDWHYSPQLELTVVDEAQTLALRTTSHMGYHQKSKDGKHQGYRPGANSAGPPGAEPYWSFVAHTPVVATQGEPADVFPVGVNPGFLRDAVCGLAPEAGGVLELAFHGTTRPIVCTFPHRPGDLALVMPLRLQPREEDQPA